MLTLTAPLCYILFCCITAKVRVTQTVADRILRIPTDVCAHILHFWACRITAQTRVKSIRLVPGINNSVSVKTAKWAPIFFHSQDVLLLIYLI